MNSPSVLRVIVVLGVLAAPATILAAFVVSRFQGALERIHPLFYLVVLIAVMYTVFWLISRKVLLELRDHAIHRAADRNRKAQ